MADLSARQHHLLRHAIGAPEHQAKCDDPHRNHVAVNPGDTDCEGLVDAGLMRRGKNAGSWTDLVYYFVTEAGVEEVRKRLPYLRSYDVETEFGIDVVYAETRSKARASHVRAIQDGWDCSWLEAVGVIKSVRLSELQPRRSR